MITGEPYWQLERTGEASLRIHHLGFRSVISLPNALTKMCTIWRSFPKDISSQLDFITLTPSRNSSSILARKRELDPFPQHRHFAGLPH
jgi:hypothetical protein